MRNLVIIVYATFAFLNVSLGQTCTVFDPNPSSLTNIVYWAGTTPTVTCSETSAPPVSGDEIIVPYGVRLNINNNGAVPVTPTPFHIGNIVVYGVLYNNKANAQLDGNITVKNGGTLTLNNILYLGDASDSPCPYNLTVDSGGILDLTGGGAADRIVICGNIIAQTGGSCNSCLIPGRTVGSTNPADYDCTLVSPIYCEPPGGFRGPFTFNDSGLPIDLIFFKASKALNKISLSWATSSELNFDYFDIEKSSDGKNFQSIATVKGNGTTKERKDYSMNDEKPCIGKNYYRLKSVDFDGYTEYFNVVMVEFDGSKGFMVSPNPSDGFALAVETNFTPQNAAFVSVYTALGAEIGRFQVEGNLSTLTMPSKLGSGVYYVKYISSDFTSTQRVLVK